jgi:hypothetical protein
VKTSLEMQGQSHGLSTWFLAEGHASRLCVAEGNAWVTQQMLAPSCNHVPMVYGKTSGEREVQSQNMAKG